MHHDITSIFCIADQNRSHPQSSLTDNPSEIPFLYMGEAAAPASNGGSFRFGIIILMQQGAT